MDQRAAGVLPAALPILAASVIAGRLKSSPLAWDHAVRSFSARIGLRARAAHSMIASRLAFLIIPRLCRSADSIRFI